ncbi:MAG: chromate transporter [Erysipelothrix sp.]|nr:chromate transporter [Erysipelothrix sp.]
MELLSLFWVFFKIGLFTIGGGIASLPLIETIIVKQQGWISYDEFSHLVIISEMTPGPIGINASTFVGNKLAGFIGGVVATLGNVLPSIIIVILLAKVYFKYKNLKVVNSVLNGLKPTIVGLITSATVGIVLVALFNTRAFDLSQFEISYIKIALLLLYLFILRKFKPNPILIILLSGGLGLVLL